MRTKTLNQIAPNNEQTTTKQKEKSKKMNRKANKTQARPPECGGATGSADLRVCEHADQCDKLTSDGERCRHGYPHPLDSGCEMGCLAKLPFGAVCRPLPDAVVGKRNEQTTSSSRKHKISRHKIGDYVIFDFNYGMAGKGHNGVNPMWLGRCWGYWLPKRQWNGGRVSRGECCDITVMWLCFWFGVTIWKAHAKGGSQNPGEKL